MTDYATVLLIKMGEENDTLRSAHDLANETRIPEPTASKILKILGASNLISSTRGAQGGYRLNKCLNDITLLNVIEAVEGPVALVACNNDGKQDCVLMDCCTVKGYWEPVNTAVRNSLNKITLTDMVGNKKKAA